MPIRGLSDGPARGRRDVELERSFLAAVAEHVHQARGDDEFGRRVLDRLDRAGEAFGRDIPAHLTLAQLLGEIREEAEDVAGWALQTLHVARETGVTDLEQRRLRRRLVRAAALGAMIDAEIVGALGELTDEGA